MTVAANLAKSNRPANWRGSFLRRHIAELLEYKSPANPVYRPANDVLALKELRLDLEAAWRRQPGNGGDLDAFRRQLDTLDWLRISKFFACDWPDVSVYFDVPVQEFDSASTYPSLTALLQSTSHPGILLRTRSGAGKTVACRRLVFDCFHSTQQTLAGRTVEAPNLFGSLPVWIDFSRIPRWEDVLDRCVKDGRLDRFLMDVLLVLADQPEMSIEHLQRYMHRGSGPPLLLLCDLNAIGYEQRCHIATAFSLFVRDQAAAGHRSVVTYRPLEAHDQVRVNLGASFLRADLLPVSPVLAGQYLSSIQRYRAAAAGEIGLPLPQLDDTQLDAYRRRSVELMTRYARPTPRAGKSAGTSVDEAPDEGPLISTPLLMHFLSLISPEKLLAQIHPAETPEIASISDIYAEVVRHAITRDQDQTLVKDHFPGTDGRDRLRLAYARMAARMVADGNVRLSAVVARNLLTRAISDPPPPWWPLASPAGSAIWAPFNRHRAEWFEPSALKGVWASSLVRIIGDGSRAEVAFVHDSFRDYFAGAVLLGEFNGPDDPPPARGPEAAPADRSIPLAVYHAISAFALSDPQRARNALAFFGGTLQRQEFQDFTKALLAPPSNHAWVDLLWHALQSRPIIEDGILDRIAALFPRRSSLVRYHRPELLLDMVIDELSGDIAHLTLHAMRHHTAAAGSTFVNALVELRRARRSSWIRRRYGTISSQPLTVSVGNTPITCAALLSTRHIVFGDATGNVSSYDPNTGAIITTRVDNSTIIAIAVTDDDSIIVACNSGRAYRARGTVTEWTTISSAVVDTSFRFAVSSDGALYGETDDFYGYGPEPYTVNLGHDLFCKRGIPDPKRAYSGGFTLSVPYASYGETQGFVHLQLHASNAEHRVRIHVDRVHGLLSVGDGRVATYSADGTLKVWRPEQILAQPSHTQTTCVARLHTTTVVVGTETGNVDVIDVQKRVAEVSTPHAGPVNAIAVLDSSHFVTGGHDGVVNLCDSFSGGHRQLLAHGTGVVCLGVGVGHVAVGFGDGVVVRLVDCDPFQWSSIRLRAHASALVVLSSGHVAIGTQSGVVMWDGCAGDGITVVRNYGGIKMPWDNWVWTISVLWDGAIVSSGSDGIIQRCAVLNGTADVIGRHDAGVRKIVQLSDDAIVSIGDDDRVSCWSVSARREIWRVKIVEPYSAALLGSGEVVVSSRRGQIVLIDAESGRIITEYWGLSAAWDVVACGAGREFCARFELGGLQGFEVIEG